MLNIIYREVLSNVTDTNILSTKFNKIRRSSEFELKFKPIYVQLQRLVQTFSGGKPQTSNFRFLRSRNHLAFRWLVPPLSWVQFKLFALGGNISRYGLISHNSANIRHNHMKFNHSFILFCLYHSDQSFGRIFSHHQISDDDNTIKIVIHKWKFVINQRSQLLKFKIYGI